MPLRTLDLGCRAGWVHFSCLELCCLACPRGMRAPLDWRVSHRPSKKRILSGRLRSTATRRAYEEKERQPTFALLLEPASCRRAQKPTSRLSRSKKFVIEVLDGEKIISRKKGAMVKSW